MVKDRAAFVKMLHDDLQESIKQNLKNGGGHWDNIGDPNCGRTALKRKITYLRRELLNLESEVMK